MVDQVLDFLGQHGDQIVAATATLISVLIYIFRRRAELRDAWNQGKAHMAVAKVVTGAVESVYQDAKITVDDEAATPDRRADAAKILDTVASIKGAVQSKIDDNPATPEAVASALKTVLGKQ